MIRRIEGFHQDDEGEWVAELSCLHGQHVRHQPPFRERPWVVTADGRASRIGAEIECPLCDRAELPDGLTVARTAGPFEAESLPAGLRTVHQVGAHAWGRLRILEGGVTFDMETDPPIHRTLEAGDAQPIPPEVPHRLTLGGPVRLAVDFLVRDLA